MRCADWIFKTLADRGAKHVFLVTGGGAMFLNDALRCEKRLVPVCCHHEQGAAIAAEGYARVTGEPGIVSVTTGPGGTNALTGVIGAWLDSVPVVFVSGQVKKITTIRSCPELKLRQLGDQEINIVDIVRPVTKYAKFVADPKSIRRELETALWYAVHGRPGPVWLDVPIDVQSAEVAEAELEPFVPPEEPEYAPTAAEISRCAAMLREAQRPVIVAGNGIRLAGAKKEFLAFIEKFGIPALGTFNGMDMLDDGHPLNAGRIGTIGQRAGNFVLQNADLILSLGSRNNIRQVSYNWENFGCRAAKIAVDIDPAELGKRLFEPDLAIAADAKKFITALDAELGKAPLPDWKNWREWCAERRRLLPALTDEHREWKNGVNPYFFMHEVCRAAPEGANIVAGNGTACVALFQTACVSGGKRIFWNSGCASMGYDLPAALGAATANGRVTVALAGDGSIMMNLQELQTIVRGKLPVKIFVLDNDGYSSIKQTQRNFFGPELIGCDDASGVSFPDFVAVGAAFGLKTGRLTSQENLAERLRAILAEPGPSLTVVKLPPELGFAPKLSSRKLADGTLVSATLEDMFPFLDREEFARHMIDPEPRKG